MIIKRVSSSFFFSSFFPRNTGIFKEIKGILGIDSLKEEPKKFNVDYLESNNTLKIDLMKEVL